MTNTSNNNRGQVGIGTLIVFIAMVLVAAIAAGVLVNTAGFLQETAEQTGQESQAQVSDRLIELQSYAVVGNDGTATPSAEVHEISMIVAPAAGSDKINLQNATLSWIGPDGAHQFKLWDDAAGTNGDWRAGVSVTTMPTDGQTVLSPNGEKAVISIDLTADIDTAGAINPMLGSEEATLTLTTMSGASTEVRVQMPSVIVDGDTIEL
jgi:flagellin FlaA/flagellin FlaB